ncbi:preprotein translocase subunit SecG [Taibaiella chishuiensis]|uniref:Protein-export membrane protein SecG n=1 Tax=Taibaiella chishuiensis TaxID=1434707 RepID=A0A2P8D5V4_9BACT|nr:preprotein translocase subunit SecG [Taibaiella chishuiensis]PSK92569.1 preprotein translocase subunit SecG [Taibaiella chishuiensis]
MTTLIVIIIMIACLVLGFFVLIQKPKGGGLSGSFGSIGTQVMGVKQSGDVMEKGTWYTMAIIAVLCVGSVFTLGRINPNAGREKDQAAQQQQQQQQQGQKPAAPAK